jgi:D-alanyl-D-alanine dipeptidase
MALRPWSSIPIHECGEPLLPLPPDVLRIEPHPYASVGAPYGEGASPFRLRQGVIERLRLAQCRLQDARPELQLAIFDAWRPLAVQRYMVEFSIAGECAARGVDAAVNGPARDAVVAEVGRFWAPPSDDPTTPPPHSTGAAVDLTLARLDGALLDMGSAIDAIGAVSEPEHYRERAERSGDHDQRERFRCWHARRSLLREAMAAAGFAQHPNEWWHFSWGDQLWAWRSGQPIAIYGRSGC